MKEHAVPESHPPRLMSRHRTNHNIDAPVLNQSSSGKTQMINSQKGDKMNKVATLSEADTQCGSGHFTPKQIDILKNSICKGVSNEEFEVFLMACQKTQLDPFMRQIYEVKSKQKKADGTWGETMTIQTGIDGYRLIAERTERYAPGPEPTYVYDKNGQLISSTSYIKKQTKDGTWHTVSASAYLDEYCQTFIDKQTGEKKPTGMWVNMQRTMLAKCAEAQALRKAFPAEMSGIYTKEEMEQADFQIIDPPTGNKITKQIMDPSPSKPIALLSNEQITELVMILSECEEEYQLEVDDHIKKYFGPDLSFVPAEMFDRIKSAAVNNMEKNHEKQRKEAPQALSKEAQ